MIVDEASGMVWHLVRAFTRAELEGRADRSSNVILQYNPHAGWYEFRIMAGSHAGLSDVLDVIQGQVDRMRQELADSGR